ncbi:MAG: hypothetical protein LBM75_09125 [Myxococcales bacterium]|nr:hypothetical protein [Myxococcales bacterium]
MRGLLRVALVTLVLGSIVSVPLFWKARTDAVSSDRSSDEVVLVLHGILRTSDGQCAVLFTPDSGEHVLPIFIQPFEAETLFEMLRVPNDREQQLSSDRMTLALIDKLGGQLEGLRIETPEPLRSKGRLLLRGPSGRFALSAPGFLVISLALFTTATLSIDRAGLEAWALSKRDFQALLDSLERGAQAQERSERNTVDPAPGSSGSIDL